MKTDSKRQPDLVWIDDQFWKLTPILEPLLDAGCSYAGIESYQEALDKIELTQKSKLIILDIIIAPGNPEINVLDRPYLGRELLSQLRNNGVDQPVIVFTLVRERDILENIRLESNVVGVFMKGERNTREFTQLAKSILQPTHPER